MNAALREIRRALLEADVALDVVRDLTEKVRVQARRRECTVNVVIRPPCQMVVKIVYDVLVETLGGEGPPIDLNAAPPRAIILMVGPAPQARVKPSQPPPRSPSA